MHPVTQPAARARTVAVACARCALLIGLVFAIDRAFAAGPVYRCGNTFQDRPCTTAANGPVAEPRSAPRDTPTAPLSAPASPPVRADRPTTVVLERTPGEPRR